MIEHIELRLHTLRFDALACGPRSGEPVLFLHGFPQFADAWAPIMEAIAGQGYRAVAVDQRGYSPGARPAEVEAYSLAHLEADVLGFAKQLGAERFHLVGHDWGGLVAWRVAAAHPERLRSLTVLSTPHPNAFLHAVENDRDQKKRSAYITLFRAPKGVAETALLGLHAFGLRRAYQGKLPEAQVESNIRRLSEDGAMTAALNWYRALDMQVWTGEIRLPTLYLWSDGDTALGEAAALATARYVRGPYRFERLAGKSHWLVEEASENVQHLLLLHLREQSG